MARYSARNGIMFTLGRPMQPEQLAAVRLAMALYGGSVTSRLFLNVRERDHLCYYCSSSFQSFTGSMAVNSGVEHADAARAEQAVLKELADLCDGPITDEELEDCRRGLLAGMNGLEDTLGGIETWYYMEVLRGGPVQTPDDARRALLAVTREDVRDILVGFGALAVCAAAALVFFYGDHAGWQYAVFYCVGLLCFLLQLGRTVIHRVRQAIDEQAQLENYKNLAYVDSLTGLFNYTAFKYMKSRWPERTDWTYIVMDVNWLKQTNDQYGHRAGDELLCCAARCIREAFYRAEDCFRIGGDEFAVIATAADEDAVKAAVEKLRNLCAEWDAKEEYPVSIAVGHAMQAGRTMTADELFMEADAAMYRNKAEIKKAVGGIIR